MPVLRLRLQSVFLDGDRRIESFAFFLSKQFSRTMSEHHAVLSQSRGGVEFDDV